MVNLLKNMQLIVYWMNNLLNHQLDMIGSFPLSKEV